MVEINASASRVQCAQCGLYIRKHTIHVVLGEEKKTQKVYHAGCLNKKDLGAIVDSKDGSISAVKGASSLSDLSRTIFTKIATKVKGLVPEKKAKAKKAKKPKQKKSVERKPSTKEEKKRSGSVKGKK